MAVFGTRCVVSRPRKMSVSVGLRKVRSAILSGFSPQYREGCHRGMTTSVSSISRDFSHISPGFVADIGRFLTLFSGTY